MDRSYMNQILAPFFPFISHVMWLQSYLSSYIDHRPTMDYIVLHKSSQEEYYCIFKSSEKTWNGVSTCNLL